jgi:hypothetical protein
MRVAAMTAAALGLAASAFPCVKSSGATEEDQRLASLVCDRIGTAAVEVYVGTGVVDADTIAIELSSSQPMIAEWTARATAKRKGGQALLVSMLNLAHKVKPEMKALAQVKLSRVGETGPRITATRDTPEGKPVFWYRDDPR